MALAVVVWLFAMNMHDPLVNETIVEPLQLENEEVLERYGLVLLNRDELLDTRISIGVRALRSAFDELLEKEEADFFPFVDLRAIDSAKALGSDGPDAQELPVNVNLTYGFDLQFRRDASVEVQLDRLVRQSFPVEVEYIGQVSEGFELRSIQAVNHHVTVTGARTHVDRVAFVQVAVDLANADSDIEKLEVPLAVFDHFGADMTNDVTLIVVETSVRGRVLPVRTVDIRIAPVGQIASGFALAAYIESSELTVDVVGTADILDETEYILLEFDMSGLTEDYERPLAIADFLPAGLELSHYAPTEVIASVEIEPVMRRTFSVPGSNISQFGFGVLADPIYAPPTSVRVVVSGAQSRVIAMNAQDIGIEIDLRGLPIGIHRVPMTASLPFGVVLAEPLQSIEMQIHAPARDEPALPEDPPPEPTPTPTPTPSPTPTPEPTPPPDENGNGENGNDEYPPDYPDNGEPYPPDDPDDDPYNGYYYEGD